MRYKEELDIIFAREEAFQKKLIKPLLLVLALVFVVSSALLIDGRRAYAKSSYEDLINIRFVSTQDIENAKNARDEARRRAQNARNQVSSLNSQANTIRGELNELNQMSEEQKAQYEIIAAQLEAALEAKAEALDMFIESQENLTNQQNLFANRISVMFEYQNKSTLEILLESDSIAGFFTNMEIITLIADSDAQAIDMLQIALDDAELQADSARQQAEEMQGIADEKQAQLDELEARIGVTQSALDNVNTQIDTWEQQEDALEEEARRLDRQVAQLQAQYIREHPTPTPTPRPASPGGGGGGGGYIGGYTSGQGQSANGIHLIWPAGSHSVSSYYGNRVHPVYGTVKFHSGVDIRGGYGASIVAAASGTVIAVSLPVPGHNTGGSGYGNYLIIDHGNGVSTLYGHCRNIYVHNGQSVSAGQQIAEIGSTGTSTGAHLHFEVRLSGSTSDPLKYLP